MEMKVRELEKRSNFVGILLELYEGAVSVSDGLNLDIKKKLI